MKLAHILAGFALLALALTIGGAIVVHRLSGGELPLSGWIAYGFGAGLSILVSGGLFFLLFYSARHGYDDIGPPGDNML